jgi:hypothetical protein
MRNSERQIMKNIVDFGLGIGGEELIREYH